jgi:hypothetical protein
MRPRAPLARRPTFGSSALPKSPTVGHCRAFNRCSAAAEGAVGGGRRRLRPLHSTVGGPGRLPRRPHSYTHRHLCTAPRAGTGSGSNFSIPQNSFVWHFQKIVPRAPARHPKNVQGKIFGPPAHRAPRCARRAHSAPSGPLQHQRQRRVADASEAYPPHFGGAARCTDRENALRRGEGSFWPVHLARRALRQGASGTVREPATRRTREYRPLGGATPRRGDAAVFRSFSRGSRTRHPGDAYARWEGRAHQRGLEGGGRTT